MTSRLVQKDFRCSTHRPLSSSFLRIMFRIYKVIPKKELLRGLWVVAKYRWQAQSTALDFKLFSVEAPVVSFLKSS